MTDSMPNPLRTWMRAWNWAWLCAMALVGCTNIPLGPSVKTPVAPSPLPHKASDILPAQFLTPADHNDQVSLLLQQLKDAKDDRTVLLARVHMLEMQLQAKDQLLLQAAKELKAAKKEIEQTQADSQKWKIEIEALRHKLDNNESENVQALKEVIGTLEQLLKQKKP